MHDKEYNDLLKKMQDFNKKLKKGGPEAKKLAKDFLFRAGITTKAGNIAKPYWGGMEPGQKCPKRKNAKDKKNRK